MRAEASNHRFRESLFLLPAPRGGRVGLAETACAVDRAEAEQAISATW
jgi:hypothetical protein